MKLQQLSVFMENRPGQLSLPCRALAEAGIDILTLSLADTQQFGILRVIVRDWQKGKRVLEEAGCVVKVTEVLALEVPDKPGGLAGILATLEGEQINVEYMYAFSCKCEGQALLVFRFEDPDAALEVLHRHQINVLEQFELYGRLDGDASSGSTGCTCSEQPDS